MGTYETGSVMPLFTIGLAILPSARSEDALHYKWLPGKRFAYDVTIVAEEPENGCAMWDYLLYGERKRSAGI